jgi:hypothetical protein
VVAVAAAVAEEAAVVAAVEDAGDKRKQEGKLI